MEIQTKINPNIFKFQDEEDSEEEIPQNKQAQPAKIYNNQNGQNQSRCQKQHQSNSEPKAQQINNRSIVRDEHQYSKTQSQFNKQSDTNDEKLKRTTAITMRRDRSFRVNSQKKLHTHKVQQKKMNQSLYKSNNIFQWAQLLSERSQEQTKNMMHIQQQQNYRKQKQNSKSNKNIIEQKGNKKNMQHNEKKLIDQKLANQGNSNFYLSSIQGNNNNSRNSNLKFVDQFNIKLALSSKQTDNMMRKTANTESNPFKKNIRQIVQKKMTLNPQIGAKIIKTRLNSGQIVPKVDFVHKKIQKDKILTCRLLINNDGFNYFWPQFHLVQQKDGSLFLNAKKKAANTTSNYYISISDKDIDVQNQNYCGKLRSNFLGSVFNIYSEGLNPQNYVKTQKSKIRQLLGTVTYENTTGTTNPKSMKLYLLKPPYTYYELQGTTKKQQQTSLAQLYQIGNNNHKIIVYRNRKPIFSKKYNKFIMNFDGRVKKPSVKNFILQDPITKQEVLMLGKIQQQEFILHISYPLSPHIGLAVALAQLDNKILID